MLPPLVDSASAALPHLAEHGMALIDPQLDPQLLQSARDATYAAAEEDQRLGRKADEFGLDYGDGNVRVWNILGRDPLCAGLVEHPIVMSLLKEVLGWPALLGNISANIALPGSEGGALHADQLFMPQPWPEQPQGMNFAWLLDDFTGDNGATEVVPLSHRKLENADQSAVVDAVPIVAPAGTLMVLESRLWHRTGANRSSAPRAALFGWYTRPIYRTQENWFLSLQESDIEGASEELLTLLGYRTQGLGLVYGRSPR